jgi:hypothetical protein
MCMAPLSNKDELTVKWERLHNHIINICTRHLKLNLAAYWLRAIPTIINEIIMVAFRNSGFKSTLLSFNVVYRMRVNVLWYDA